MEDYQERVIEEKKALDVKVVKLASFIFSDQFLVPKDEQERMERQFYSMIEYSRALRDRIYHFTSEPK